MLKLNNIQQLTIRCQVNLESVNTEMFIDKVLNNDDKIYNSLIAINGISDVEYDGHFGKVILYTIESLLNTFSLQKRILKIIETIINE